MLTLKADLAPVQSKLAAIPPAVQSALSAYALAAAPMAGKADSLRQGLSHARRVHPDRETALKSVSGERGRGALRHGVERAPARADLHRLAVQAALAALGRGS